MEVINNQASRNFKRISLKKSINKAFANSVKGKNRKYERVILII
jgi:hypothetical protein